MPILALTLCIGESQSRFLVQPACLPIRLTPDCQRHLCPQALHQFATGLFPCAPGYSTDLPLKPLRPLGRNCLTICAGWISLHRFRADSTATTTKLSRGQSMAQAFACPFIRMASRHSGFTGFRVTTFNVVQQAQNSGWFVECLWQFSWAGNYISSRGT